MELKKDKLFRFIEGKLSKNISLIDDVADVLDINYDAAYRRVKGKTALTLEDGLILSEHYNFDLNTLLLKKTKDTEKIIVEKTHEILSDNFLNIFFDKSKEETQQVLNSKEGKIINCAKDYPFYHSDNGFLKKFRIFLFLNMLSEKAKSKPVLFSEFNPSKAVLEKYETFLNQYSKVALVEIWNDTTIDNILNQIQYFFEVGLTTEKEAVAIADGLIASLRMLEEQAENQKRKESDNSFHLYHNNLISLLNTVLMKSDSEKKVFVPYTNLTYFKVVDEETTSQIEQHLKKQLQFSTNISGEASVERKKFFNSMYQKIEKRKLKLNF
ncbi:hypothetical protein H9I45_08860 [Polaribacter haliotis]|uniref:Transcription regulator BetR N-terminal domain-containing protein n=1 Tax=Polaribacter haliotis TaxID=1888915 RepID=A0A7L8ABV6_9FLAO|nr:hypothetical protein [Polaribacter haliotis]QOD59480.1 hypothetical protein H9I45_08860 [Polaribacter haliotis]